MEGKSAPNHLLENAEIAIKKFDIDDSDELWFVLDIDKREISKC